MKYVLIVAGLLASSFTAAFAGDAPAPAAAPAPATQPAYPADMDTVAKRVSYGIGVQFGTRLNASLKTAPFQVDSDLLVQGLRDAITGKTPRLTTEQVAAAMNSMQETVAAQSKIVGMKNQKEGEEFLAKNKTAEGVKTTASGLQYKVIKEGAGKSPTKDDTVTVNYKGTLVNGKVFDSSEGREPLTIPVGRVIPGWTEGLQLMKVGGKAQFFIPSNLAYGENVPPGGPIPPNSVLIFEVELLSVK